jgi:hypothetical protein
MHNRNRYIRLVQLFLDDVVVGGNYDGQSFLASGGRGEWLLAEMDLVQYESAETVARWRQFRADVLESIERRLGND